MADPPADAETSDDAGADDRGSPPRTPRWVKVSGTMALIVVVLLVVLLVAGGGQHGPGRHLPGGGSSPQQQQPGGQIPSGMNEGQTPSGAGAAGHTPPPGGHR